MKKYLIATYLVIFCLTACKKNEVGPTQTTTLSILRQGQWKVTLFVDNGTDKTTEFGIISGSVYSKSYSNFFLSPPESSRKKIGNNFLLT